MLTNLMRISTFSRLAPLVVPAIVLVFASQAVLGQQRTPEPVHLLENKTFDDSQETRQEILAAYEDLRVPDVVDALDLIGLQDITLFDRDIRPLWRDTEDFTHRMVGFALTVRYLPSDVRVGEGSFDSIEEAQQWVGEQYGRAGEDFMDAMKPGDILVVDQNGAPEGGHIGSMNSLGWAAEGMNGVVTNGGTRDTDEIVKTEAIPVYTRSIARGIRPGRTIIDAYNVPINCGGVTVYPGDVIVADGDGVISVPREHAMQVAELARDVMTGDQGNRADLYEELGIPIDDTVREYLDDN